MIIGAIKPSQNDNEKVLGDVADKKGKTTDGSSEPIKKKIEERTANVIFDAKSSLTRQESRNQNHRNSMTDKKRLQRDKMMSLAAQSYFGGHKNKTGEADGKYMHFAVGGESDFFRPKMSLHCQRVDFGN